MDKDIKVEIASHKPLEERLLSSLLASAQQAYSIEKTPQIAMAIQSILEEAVSHSEPKRTKVAAIYTKSLKENTLTSNLTQKELLALLK